MLDRMRTCDSYLASSDGDAAQASMKCILCLVTFTCHNVSHLWYRLTTVVEELVCRKLNRYFTKTDRMGSHQPCLVRFNQTLVCFSKKTGLFVEG